MRVVIAGGGFGGVKAALELSKDHRFSVVLISNSDHLLYYPALYSTATGHNRQESMIPLETIFEHHKNVKVVRDTVTSITPDRRLIVGENDQYHYDSLIMALGVVTTYFGIEGLAENAFGIKSEAEVARLKQHLHDELATDKHMDKNYVVVGAGPTGVELSAALITYLDEIAASHSVRHGKIRISLVEAMPQVLPRMSKRAGTLVQKRLKQLGIMVKTNHKVQAATNEAIVIDGKAVPTETIMWTSGVTNHPFFKQHEHIFPLAKNGRVEVDEYLRGAPHVYVIGDNAATQYTGLAQTALHDAHFVTSHLKRLKDNKRLKKYTAKKPPVVVPVGKNWAIFEWGPFTFGGIVASLLRYAADFIGYSDVLSFGRAVGALHSQFERQESCETCQKNLHAKSA